MAAERTKFIVGLFVAVGLGIGLIAFIWLGMSGVIHEGKYYATYFNESVQGLDIDSPVKYRGVSIGRVSEIDVAPDSRLIEVVLRIDPGYKLDDEDIVAQLTPVGITGKMFVELDRRKEGEPDRTPQLDFVSEYPIIASKPSDISQLLHGLDDMLKQFRSLDLKGISEKVKSALDNIATIIEDARIKDVSSSIRNTFDSANRILQNERWNRIIASVDEAARSFNEVMVRTKSAMSVAEGIVSDEEETLKTAFEDFGKAMENAKTLLEKGSSLVEGTEDSVFLLRRHLLVVSKNLERASENLNRLIEFLSDQPSQLIFDKSPAPRKRGGGDGPS